MRKIEDLTGRIFGSLTVIGFKGTDARHKSLWECKCTCDKVSIKPRSSLISGFTKSCGCKVKDWKPIEYEDKTILGVPLTQGKVTIIDREDYDKIKYRNWYLSRNRKGRRDNKSGYAKAQKDRKTIKMHRLIMDCPDGLQVDHINHDRLDNRKVNLRICTSQNNAQNSRAKKGLYKGVYYDKNWKTWVASITIRIGKFTTAKEAAMAYDKKAIELFGEYAYLNFA